MKKSSIHARSFASLIVMFCLLAAPLTAFGKKGEKNFKRGLQYEAAQQWEKAAQEFTLAVAADPSNVEYQLHYRRSLFNASQQYMQQGRALAEQRDYIGAYNAFRQAYGYDPVNELSLSEMERMLRLQREKSGENGAGNGAAAGQGAKAGGPASYQLGEGGTPAEPGALRNAEQEILPPTRNDQLRVVKYNNQDLKQVIRNLAEQLGLNVVFDTQSFRAPRTVEVNLTDVTTAQALDIIFLQEGLFFQKINRRTILVADQNRRAQYQQLAIRTFYLSNIDPTEARTIVTAALPPSQGRPQPNVIADKYTNSITVRDTSENLQLIADLLRSIDKDRAEVVMDVNIYEVSRTDLLQLGNQIGTGDASGFFSLGNASGLNILAGARDVATRLSSAPTAFGAALLIPSAQLTAFQRKDRTKLVASTQVHAFSGEESTARIGQRVPVQTAQTFPFASTNTPTQPGGVTGGVNFGGGFPVIQYEPTGLTLRFTPQVFPNLDVQVKMSIESKDILNAGSLTPTFTERTITGTARVQNNRTMMLASVAQDTQSNGRRGLPLLGLIPVLGRLFTSPTRNDTQIDIVIAITPRVLRAPAVTPLDERERPSGTLSAPTSGSLEAMVREADREDQLAAARRIPTNVVVQLPDAEPPPTYVPAPKTMMSSGEGAAAAATAVTAQPVTAKAETTNATNAALMPVAAGRLPLPSSALANALAQVTNEPPPAPAALVDKSVGAGPRVVEVAQPVSASSTPPATTAGPGESARNQTSAGSSLGNKIKATLFGKPPALPKPQVPVVLAHLMPESQQMRVGEKRRIALVLTSKEPLGNIITRLRFDPSILAVRGISQGEWPDGAQSQPTIMQSIDPAGLIALAISPQAGAPLKSGANAVLFIEVEAVATGEGLIRFEDNAQVVAVDGSSLKLQATESRLSVK